MNIGRLARTAKRVIDKRGGTEALKADAQELQRIHREGGTLKDKALKAADALKDPGERGPDGRRRTPPAEPGERPADGR
jgi:hypothetical protein